MARRMGHVCEWRKVICKFSLGFSLYLIQTFITSKVSSLLFIIFKWFRMCYVTSFLHRALCGPSMHLQPVCLYFIYIPMQVLLTTTLHVFITDQTLPVTMQLSMILASYVQIITQYGHRCFRSSLSDQKLWAYSGQQYYSTWITSRG